MTDPLYLVFIIQQKFWFEKEGIIEKNSYEHRACESVIYEKLTENKTQALMPSGNKTYLLEVK